jgi:hypothetical protein
VKLQWALIAEGVTADARGAVTAVGVAQTVLVAPALPAQAKRAVVALITGENKEFVPGRQFTFSGSVTGPSGKTLSGLSGAGAIGPLPYPDLPAGLSVAAEAAFTVTEYGRHVIKLVVQVGDDPDLEAEMDFYVAKPPAALIAAEIPARGRVEG